MSLYRTHTHIYMHTGVSACVQTHTHIYGTCKHAHLCTRDKRTHPRTTHVYSIAPAPGAAQLNSVNLTRDGVGSQLPRSTWHPPDGSALAPNSDGAGSTDGISVITQSRGTVSLLTLPSRPSGTREPSHTPARRSGATPEVLIITTLLCKQTLVRVRTQSATLQ
jgi:hypothetical protein